MDIQGTFTKMYVRGHELIEGDYVMGDSANEQGYYGVVQGEVTGEGLYITFLDSDYMEDVDPHLEYVVFREGIITKPEPRKSRNETFLVAFNLELNEDKYVSETRERFERWLHLRLKYLAKPTLKWRYNLSWWVAEDTRYDGSDCDPAVFVDAGKQHDAWALLHASGMTGRHNEPSTD